MLWAGKPTERSLEGGKVQRSPTRELACITGITSWPSTKLQNRVNEQSMGVGKYE